jgi:histidinol-phosphate aminotransferase
MNTYSDYKDDGTNILLDANENAYGPGLALNGDGKVNVNGTSDSASSIDVDLTAIQTRTHNLPLTTPLYN